MWLIAFVEPTSGRNIWFLVPGLNTIVFQVVLDSFARGLKIEENKKILLVVDQAPWHTTGKLIAPRGIELVFLPPYSPELQPAEHLWALSDKVLFNKTFDDLDQLENVLVAQCENLMASKDVVSRATCFYWWKNAFIEVN